MPDITVPAAESGFGERILEKRHFAHLLESWSNSTSGDGNNKCRQIPVVCSGLERVGAGAFHVSNAQSGSMVISWFAWQTTMATLALTEKTP